MRLLFGITFFLGIHLSLCGQIFLQLEKAGSFKVERFTIGDEVCFKVKDNPFFRTEYIEDILLEENLIVFSNGMVQVENIEAIRDFEKGAWMRGFGQKLILFGVAWSGYAGIAALLGEPLTLFTAVVVGSAVISGWLLRKIFKHKTYRFGKNRRLRILDMRLLPVSSP